ncbi:leucine-rich repeat and guanylate kinase domain-containing protein-like [Anneissia japonica]|uniref:leucine-rich repeat and guanylate kinase domain-containing protein-like n=1 Tax=Anneissia japonica TaxID=1529436 RepID=UPI001425B482|nr:leucine-rich repeat and guanylate kinase domain-containing protein-like [Anneissia japonica]
MAADMGLAMPMSTELSFSPFQESCHETNILSLGSANYVDSTSPLSNEIYNAEKQSQVFENSGSEDDELSPNGILDEETVAFGLSNLGRSSDGSQLVYLHLTLPGYNLVDISRLQEFVHVQKVEIPYNKVSDLSVLSYMPYLIELDASHNEIKTMLDFKPPQNLQEVDLSYNQIEIMENLSSHHALTKLIVDNNQISKIDGLSKCVRLNHLSLAHNNISELENMQGLPLKYLNLSGNKLCMIKNIGNLKWLQNINLSGNQISSLSGLEGHELLEVIDLEDNNIPFINDIKFIEDLKLLRILNLMRNPIQSMADYRLSLLFRLPQISELDRRRAEADEKIAAINLFSPPADVVAAHDHRKCMVYSFLKPAKVLASTLPTTDQPYPILILVGPVGSGKRELAQKLVVDFPEYFGYGVPHSTRAPQNGELESCDFRFVTPEQFTKNLKQGNFILTYQQSGHCFGLTIDAIEDVAKEGLACITHMELEGVLSMKLTYFEPRYVLLLPLDKDAHKKRLEERGGFSALQIESAITRDDLYQDMNDQKPGFFDVTIDSSNLKDAYRQLKKLLLEYLGIEDFNDDFDTDSFIQEISDGSASTSENSNSRCYTSMVEVKFIISVFATKGVLSMKLTYFEPRYVLLLPLDKDAHKKRLEERGGFSALQIESAITRDDLYQDMNDQKPGFFDVTIDSSNLKDAYRQLKKLLLEYLGIEDFNDDFDTDSFIQEISDGSASTSENSNSRMQSQPQSMGKPDNTMNSEPGIRTWSRNASQEGSHKVSPSIRKKMEPSKSLVEQASYERRKSAAIATAACGSVPSPIEQLNRLPKTAPPSLQQDVLNGYSKSDSLSQDFARASSPDSSEDDARSNSNLSNLSEARGFSAVQSPLGSQVSIQSAGTDRLRKSVLSNSPLNLIEQLSRSHSPTSGGSRPGSGGSRPGSGRPGSEKKAVLPPITDKSQPEY